VETCYFCPRNLRVGGARNPDYRSIFVFDNDHPCVGEDAPRALEPPPGVYRNAPATGVARVVCYTPRHDATLAELPVGEIAALLATWREQYLELGARPDVRHVLTFENKGDVVGVSNPHPHGQIYATNFVFRTIETEAAASRRYYRETAARCSRTSSAPSARTGAACSSRAVRRWCSCRTSPGTRTSATWRRRRRTPASPR
jgi:UDPglucose--hexose-1-phosphate uridylyltransferase